MVSHPSTMARIGCPIGTNPIRIVTKRLRIIAGRWGPVLGRALFRNANAGRGPFVATVDRMTGLLVDPSRLVQLPAVALRSAPAFICRMKLTAEFLRFEQLPGWRRLTRARAS